ncbi:hypothetical protein DIDNDMLP_00121 [Klebsiella phage KP13-7]|nr:hypothetical protein DIDNDMLP_00121 [Klebsiella phage KP13-7]
MARKDILEQKELILDLISKNTTKSTICKILNCKSSTLDTYLKKMGIIYKGNQSGKGKKKGIHSKYVEASKFLNKNSSISSNQLKRKLLREGYFEHKCSKCGLTEWMGKPIPIELEHKDGDNTNNEIENLCLLCPNCHAQTDTYKGKNIKSVREKKHIQEILDFENSFERSKIKEPIENKKRILKIKEIKKCEECGNEYTGRSKKYCSHACLHLSQRKFNLTYEELKDIIWKYPRTKIGEMYNVSDNTVLKRCRLLGIEVPPLGYFLSSEYKDKN